ncbi:arginyltransferase [Alkalimarinus alittae]|uniref:Aspartate/glutamate leucyltransferase n=1 Tax=Alkalimarinus alittae TaxID=2961619 RepID=A0ABY6N752_9ALTE|nr:arginyltransferase [Alkalimarinus alittae]UZE97938.1 arginyltransferase [Alkalimarinus alittae]
MSSLQTLIFYATPEHNCSYLEAKKATTMFVDPKASVDKELYSKLSVLGFRRSGNHYYRPHCNHCSACVPVRVPVNQFKPSRSQKRILKKNIGLEISITPPEFCQKHYDLYEKYIIERHSDGDMYPPSEEQYRSFLVEGNPSTFFVEFKYKGELIGVSVIDELNDGLSAVYTYFDPDISDRSLGVYSVLWQIEECKRRSLDHIYLGYWIKSCRKMEYKTLYKPVEFLISNKWTLQEPNK